MGVFDGDVIRIRVLKRRANPQRPVEITRWAYTEREAKNIVRGFKGRPDVIGAQVEELHYVTHSRADLSFGEDWD